MNKREWMLQASLIALGQNQIDWMAPHVAMSGLGAVYDAICAATPETAQDGAWVEHDGDVSKAPPADSTTEVVYRDGSTETGMSREVAWDWCDDGMDVLRWRYA